MTNKNVSPITTTSQQAVCTEDTYNQQATEPEQKKKRNSLIIWTPRFILTFFLIFSLGLSLASIVTQGWLNGYYAAEQILLAETTLNLFAWLLLALRAHTGWIRLGGIFGCFWAVFSMGGLIFSWRSLFPDSPIIVHVNTATNTALLGAFLCLSLDTLSFTRWDRWFFRLVPLLAACTIGIVYLAAPDELRSSKFFEQTLSGTTLFLCIAVWWLRPSCWRWQPAPTLLFGLVPVILFLLAIPGLASGEANFFFLQVIQLCILLGIIRTWQKERRSLTS